MSETRIVEHAGHADAREGGPARGLAAGERADAGEGVAAGERADAGEGVAPGQGPAAASSEPDGEARSAPPGLRPTWVEVDLDAIAANVAALKAQSPAPRLMAVVKADGYGHGLVPAARAALAGGADWLAVALVEEGQALRAAGVRAPVLVMAQPPAVAIPPLLDADLTPAVYTLSFMAALDAAVRERAQDPVGVHLKLDTGMRRVGVPQADWEDALRALAAAPGLRLEALWSHLAAADEPGNPFNAHQAAEFRRGLALAESLGLRADLAHLCNSAGTLDLHEEHHDMVRPGLSIYGLEPAPGMGQRAELRPALSWRSRLSLVKRLAAGEAVSYGLRWAPEDDTTLATVPAGYADGVRRALSGRGSVLVRGRRAPIAGTVCMDQFCIDAGQRGAAVDDEVVLIGEQGEERITADDWAALLDTISYEIVCGIGRRVPRTYIGGAGAP